MGWSSILPLATVGAVRIVLGASRPAIVPVASASYRHFEGWEKAMSGIMQGLICAPIGAADPAR
jgi:hypothetical protein